MENQLLKHYSEDLAENIVLPFFSQWKCPICVIYGNPDTGKTDTALLLVEIALNEGVLDIFASNIETYGKGVKITNFEEMDAWFKSVHGKKCYILDEAANVLFSRDALSRLNRALIKEAMLLRKFQSHFIIVIQEIDMLDTFKSSELTGMMIKKLRFGDEFRMKVKTRWDENIFKVTDVPKTAIPFHTLDISPFTLKGDNTIMPEWVLKNEDYKILWEWSVNNKSVSDLGLHPQELNRKVRRFVKNILQNFSHFTPECRERNNA